jgi:hypothetical protein
MQLHCIFVYELNILKSAVSVQCNKKLFCQFQFQFMIRLPDLGCSNFTKNLVFTCYFKVLYYVGKPKRRWKDNIKMDIREMPLRA